MSDLKHACGNLLDMAEAGDFDVVVQGCNCFNTMGGGIAREIRERYPNVAEVDAASQHADYNKLGNWTSAPVYYSNMFASGNFVIINAYTQYDMSTGADVFEYEAFKLILQKLAWKYPTFRFGFPYIGMGLANGNKNKIIPMLEDFAETMSKSGGSVTLVKF